MNTTLTRKLSAIALMLTFALMGALVLNGLQAIAPSEMGGVQPAYAASKSSKAKAAYKKYLKKHNAYASKIVNIDKKGVPELIVCFAGDMGPATYDMTSKVYTYKKGKMKLVKKFQHGRGGNVHYNAKKHFVTFESGFFGGRSYTAYKMTSGKLKRVKYFETWRGKAMAGSSAKRAADCSQATFNSLCKKYAGSKHLLNLE